MSRQIPVLLVVAATAVFGCAQDPTATAEYGQLEAELASTEAALADSEAQAAQLVEERGAGSADPDVVAEVRAVQEEWFAAWNAEDGDAVLSMMASGGRHYCPATGTQGVSGGDLAAFVEEGWEMTGADIVSATRTHTSGDPAAVKDDYVVVTEFTLNGHPGYLSILHLRGPEGSLRVLDHHAYPPSPQF